MISLYDLAVNANTPTGEALGRVDAVCKAWGEEKVILSRGARPDKDTMISDEAAEMVYRMTRLKIWDRVPEPGEGMA